MPADFSLETSGQSPLRRFKGTLQSLEREERQGDRSSYEVALFEFIELEVIEATTPYPFPTAALQISHSGKTETKWAAFADSVKRVLGVEVGVPVPKTFLGESLVGKRQEWAMLPSPTRRPVDPDNPRGVWETAEADAWQVVSVEGAEAAAEDLTERILGIADGLTEQKFTEEMLKDEVVRKSPDTVTALTGRKLLPALLESKQLTRDAEGVLHKGA